MRDKEEEKLRERETELGIGNKGEISSDEDGS